MSEEQKAAIRAALRLCRSQLTLAARGPLDYEDAARQIAALPDAREIREHLAWVREYERAEARGQDFARAGYRGVTNTRKD